MTRSTIQATTAYYDKNPFTQLLRWTLAATETLWPRLAIRSAARLFVTPLPHKWSNKWSRARRRWDASWALESWSYENASITLYADQSAQPAAAGSYVLLVHGWGGHAGQMLPLASAMRAQGLRPILIELPAHGRSKGTQSNLPQFARAIEYVAAKLAQDGKPLYAVVAHSLAANASAYAASRSLATQRLVLIAPPASPFEYTKLFAKVFKLSEFTRAGMQQQIEASEGILMRQFEPNAVGPRIAQAVLLVHDSKDSINPFADGLAYQQAIAGAEMVQTEGLGHRYILKDENTIRKIVNFVGE
jgi:pimeloyl-ACP methyl ester carboxylesterase